jgi:RNase P subunit RPR2
MTRLFLLPYGARDGHCRKCGSSLPEHEPMYKNNHSEEVGDRFYVQYGEHLVWQCPRCGYKRRTQLHEERT